MTAFLEYQDATCLEHCPAVDLMPFSVTRAVTSGVTSVIGTSRASVTGSSASVIGKTLPDGRMKVGVDLPLFARRFRYLRLLGEGMSAQVVLAEDTHSQTSKLVVIKVLKRHYSNMGQKEACVLRFLQAGNTASHGGLIQLSSAFTHCGHVCLVLERLHGSLLDYVVHSACLPQPKALQNLRKVAVQLLGALALMHSKGIVHADIKPENILLTSPADSGRVGVKLIDLGNCFSVTGTDTSRISFEMQSLPFRAPEALLGGACETGIDVWSLGCVLAEVALQRPLFPVATIAELVHQMTIQLGPLPSARTPHSDPLTGAHGLPSQGRGLPAPCPTAPSALRSQQAHDSTSRHTQHKSSAGSLRIQRGRLQLLHEAACPLHLELAKVDPAMASLVMAMLRYDPRQRVSAAEALQHPFLSAISPVLQLLIPNREADDKPPQHRAVGSIETQAQGVSQQACQAEAVLHGQAAGTLRCERPSGLPFKPEPRRQAFASLPFQDHPTAQAAVPAWAVNRLSTPRDQVLPATQPQLPATHPQLPAAQPQLQAAQPQLQAPPLQLQAPPLQLQASQQQLQAAQPQVQSSQPQLQAAQPQLQVSQQQLQRSLPHLQPPQGTLSPLTAQKPTTLLPDRTADITAADWLAPATASATAQLPAVASANVQHNPLEMTAQGSSSRGVHLPAVLPAAGPSPGPSLEKLASLGVATCSHPAEQADPSSPPLVEQVAGEAAIETTLALGQGPVKTPGLAGAGAIGTPLALGPGLVRTPGLVKAWKGVTELLQQMSPASQIKAPPQSLSQALQAAQPSATPPHPTDSPPHVRPPVSSPRQAPRQTQQATLQQLTHPLQQGQKSSAALQTLPKQRQKQQAQDTKGSLPEAQPRQQQQAKQGPLLQAQPKQRRKQQQAKQGPSLEAQPRQPQKQTQVTHDSLQETQPKQQHKQQQEAKGPLLEALATQQQRQQHGQLKADHSAAPSASEPMSLTRHRAAALGPNAQPAGLDQGSGISTEADPDVPFSQQSHVSASPSTSKSESGRPATSQQQQQHGSKVVGTIADNAAQSSHVTQAFQGCSRPMTDQQVRPVTAQPVLHESSRSANIAAGACYQGLVQASGVTAEPQEIGTGGQLTSSGALPAALEPAGPDADACSGGDGVPASIDKSMQLPEQMTKHQADALKAGVQKRKSIAHAPGNTARRPRSRLQQTVGRAAEHKSRTTSRATSAAPAESQQSAVHAALPGPPHQSMPVKGVSTLKGSMPAAQGQMPSEARVEVPCDARTASTKAKRSRAELTVSPAGVKDAEQSKKRSRPHLGSMPPISNTSQPGGQEQDTGSPQTLSSDECDLRHDAGGLKGGAEKEELAGLCPPRATTGQTLFAESSSAEFRPNGCARTGQSAKRTSRKRDSDANKPWWVV